jgi:ribonuclease HI
MPQLRGNEPILGLNISSPPLLMFDLPSVLLMYPTSSYHICYVDGASRCTQNLASATWALYTPSHELLHSGSICLGPATNNQTEYTTVIGLLTKASHNHFHHLSILFDSHLVILQLNNVYHVCDPCLFRKYLQVRLLSQHFDSITFTHIP